MFILQQKEAYYPGLLGRMVFLKRNMQTMDHINVFPSDLDDDFMEGEEDEWY